VEPDYSLTDHNVHHGNGQYLYDHSPLLKRSKKCIDYNKDTVQVPIHRYNGELTFFGTAETIDIW